MKAKKKAIVPPAAPENSVSKQLGDFHVIRHRQFRDLFNLTPVFLLLLLLIDWLMGGGSFTRDTFRLTGVLTIVILLFTIRVLFDRVPDALATIWERDLIKPKGGHDVQEKYLSFLDQFGKVLNGKEAWILGAVCGLGGLAATYPVQYFLKAGEFPYDFGNLVAYYLWGHGSIIAGVLGYLVGLLIWRIGVIAWFVRKLGERFDLAIQPNHPDKCGGLKPLGDLSLITAVVILIPSIYLAIWGFVTTFFENPALELYIVLWSGLFRQWLIILAVLALLAFLLPVYEIHLQMERRARKIRGELDVLSQKIDEISLELRTHAYTLTSEQGEEKLRLIEFMKKVYAENSRVPTWPFDWKTIAQFASAQALPVLSWLGTSGPLFEIIKAVLSFTSK